tara:strand:+ start:1305 stop:1580 length:276 start_codon:yes stop_codon:yes gene_type:complete
MKLMIIILLVLLMLCLTLIFKIIKNKKVFKTKEIDTFNKVNFNKWMKLTKKQRYKASEKESISYLNKRKILLDEIRNEYKRISQSESKKTS